MVHDFHKGRNSEQLLGRLESSNFVIDQRNTPDNDSTLIISLGTMIISDARNNKGQKFKNAICRYSELLDDEKKYNQTQNNMKDNVSTSTIVINEPPNITHNNVNTPYSPSFSFSVPDIPIPSMLCICIPFHTVHLCLVFIFFFHSET